MNKDAILSALRSKDGFERMIEKSKETVGEDLGRSARGGLRERQQYAGGGYQRAFNHTKFIATVLVPIGDTMVEADMPDFLQEPFVAKSFANFSRTFDMAIFDSALRLKDRNLHMIARWFPGRNKPALPCSDRFESFGLLSL